MKTSADHVERALDDALDMTFPASDPVAVFVPEVPVESGAHDERHDGGHDRDRRPTTVEVGSRAHGPHRRRALAPHLNSSPGF